MPSPKGINCPTMAEEWVAVRRETIAEFDRLVGKGRTHTAAARLVGVSRAGINAMRASVERIEEGRTIGRHGGARIDLGLALLACLRKPGVTLTARDIAAWCGCTHAAIQSIERRALTKVRRRLALADGREAC